MSKTNWESYLGVKFGRLIVTEILPSIPYKIRRCKAICECGNIKEYYVGNILMGVTTSCGCLRKGLPIKHGLSIRGNNKSLYNVYMKMIHRCYDSTVWNYKNYGGRGIIVCKEWKNDARVFAKWAIENGYKKDLQIDRFPDNNGNYEPSNCRWATHTQNANNTRSNVLLIYNGESKTIAEWASIVGMEYGSFWSRVKRGWNIIDIIEKPQRVQ